jgi:hypothetical protein
MTVMNKDDFQRYTSEYDSINEQLESMIQACGFWMNKEALKLAREKIIRNYQLEKQGQDKSGNQMSLLKGSDSRHMSQ